LSPPGNRGRIATFHKSNCPKSLRFGNRNAKETPVLGTILIILLILALIGALPRWGYSRGWGYFPSGGLGLILIILIILVLIGRI
jgi:hypothetical protein